MKRIDFESLGDRQKKFEAREAKRSAMPGLPVIARLDGRSFHSFTRGLARPFDERLSQIMVDVTKFLVAETHAAVGYTQSDEITLALIPRGEKMEMLFDGRLQKLSSVLSGLASAKFVQLIAQRIPEKAHLTPCLDCRVWDVPSLDEAADQFIWREADCTRNSVTMAAHAHYPAKALHKVGTAQKHDMLMAKGINWNDYPAFFKRGTFVQRKTVQKALSDAELARIPVARRPTGLVTRSEIQALDLPKLGSVANLNDVLFEGAAPLLLA